MPKLYEKIRALIDNISKEEIPVYAAQASYYIMIASFPFTMLLLSLTGFLTPQYKQNILRTISSVIPGAIQPAVRVLATELFDKSLPILSLSSVTALWSASRGVEAVKRGIEKIYKITKTKGFFSSLLTSVLYTVLFMGVLILTLLLQVFGDILAKWFSRFFEFSESGIYIIRHLLLFSLLFVIFTGIYYFFSKRSIPIRRHITGAIVSALGWIGFSQIFSLYIENFSNYSYIYGSLTVVVLMLLWLYVCLIIILFGAKLNELIITKQKNTFAGSSRRNGD